MTKAFSGLLTAALLWAFPACAQVKPLQGLGTPFRASGILPSGSAPEVPSLLTAALIQARAETIGLEPAVIVEKIKDSQNLKDLQSRFEGSGLLKRGELDAYLEEDALTLRYITHKLWAEATDSAKPAVEIDQTRALPALVVHAGGVRYSIHGIAHGVVRPIREREVRKLVDSLQKNGAALYSEQNLPAFFRYSYGAETLDQRILEGEPISLRDVPPLQAGFSAASARAFLSALSWVLPSSLPFFHIRFRHLSRLAANIGYQDMADYFTDKARIAYGWRWDLKKVLFNQLPMPLKASIHPDDAARSKAMAEIIAKDAAARGLKEAHIITGANHTAEIAWYLAHPL